MSVNMNDPGRLNGTTVVGGDGEKLGNVDAVYYDNATDRAEWVAVRSGLFGTRVTLVPLRRADYTGDELRVPFDKVQLRNAPHHDPGDELSSTDEADLYRYYGIDYSDTADGFARPADREAGQRTVEGDIRQERIEYDGAELDTAEHDLRDTRF
jgi:sporulation protein YlmC with PRC-barrel domain